MSLRALLLSPDDQAVNAISGVLEEMSVSCERPMDGATAAKKLNSESFDLVIVDCENLPAAKLIFDVCRRSHGGTSVPVAVVDGRVGLPTAFRLGAELILTKPVAKDQARITFRAAMGRVKKEQPAQDLQPAANDVEAGRDQQQETVVPKALAQAAAAGAGSAPAAQTATVVAAGPSASAEPVSLVSTIGASTATPTGAPVMSAPTAEATQSAAMPVQPINSPKEHAFPAKTLSTSAPASPPHSSVVKISEDPVMAALENGEPTLESNMFASYQESKTRGGRGLFLGTLALAVAGGAIYGGWMYQPGVRQFIETRLAQGKALVGLHDQQLVAPIRPTARPAPAKIPSQQPIPAPQASASPAQQASGGAAATSATNTAVASTSPAVVSVPPATAASATVDNSAETQKKMVATATSASDFTEGKNAVILSSKGAEKRLLHRVSPVISAEARAQSAEATVVLKALIDENGAVQSALPVEGNSALSDAAVKAVKQWRYKPYIRDGKYLPFQTIVVVDFQ